MTAQLVAAQVAIFRKKTDGGQNAVRKKMVRPASLKVRRAAPTLRRMSYARLITVVIAITLLLACDWVQAQDSSPHMGLKIRTLTVELLLLFLSAASVDRHVPIVFIASMRMSAKRRLCGESPHISL